MRTIVHIGLHKTGTTSIQLLLARNRELLRANGVLYPQAAAVEAGGHLNLVWEATKSWKYQAKRGGLERLIAEARSEAPEVLLISAESLSGYSKSPAPLEIVGHISEALGSKPEIVCTIRPQAFMLDSLYAQNASTGYTTKRFQDFAIEVMNRRTLEFEPLLGRWFDRFDDVVLIPVERGAPLEHRFFAAAGLENPFHLAPVTPANQRPSARVVEYCRSATLILNRMRVPPLRKRAILSAIRADVEAKHPDDPAFSGLTPAFAQHLHNHFRPTNLSFRKKRLRGARLFSVAFDYKIFRRCTVDLDGVSADEKRDFLDVFSSALDRNK